MPAGAGNQSIESWFGLENEGKICEFSMRTFDFCSSSYLFYDFNLIANVIH
jgi:hypothetical protein